MSHISKIPSPLSLGSGLSGTKNSLIENCAEVKVLFNLDSDGINISNISALKDDKISSLCWDDL